MTPMVLLLVILGWLAYGVVAAGLHFAYFQDEYPLLAERNRTSDLRGSWVLVPLGPISLLAVWLSDCAKHGWRLR